MSQTLDFVRSLGLVGLESRTDVRAASRALHVRRHEDIALHDDVFDAYWARRTRSGSRTGSRVGSLRAGAELGAHRGTTAESAARGAPSSVTRLESGKAGDGGDSPALLASRRTFSAEEVLRQRDFDRMTSDELRQAERLIDRLALSLAVRPAHRYEPHHHGTRLLPRQMLRRSLDTGGELVDWFWARPRVVPRPVTLLIDISGSMESYARLMLRFAHALHRVNRRTEVFVFGTRLTRVTRALATRHVDDALERVSTTVVDWSGGTRIGDCLREYNRHWAGRVSSSDGIAVVLSDGWDRGDPALVGEETARLRRNCRRLLWLNPLAGAAGFEPLAAGMAAAVRHIDRLLPAGSLADLDDFARLLADTEWGRTPARESGAAA